MRVLGLMTGASQMAVLETDGRAIAALGPAGRFETPEEFLAANGMAWSDLDLIGLRGPGDAQALARRAGTPVAFDFTSRDLAEGGRGGPLEPVYHRALARFSRLELPLAVQGASVTHIAANGLLTAFDELQPGRAVKSVVVWRRETMEAEATAYLAARVWNGYPITFPGTTGVASPTTGGRIARP